MRKIFQLNWLKWLPIIGNVFFSVLFYIEVTEYMSKKYIGTYFGDPLYWFDFFTTSGYVTIIISTICSFFIKNKWLKWVSVAIGMIVFIAIYQNVGKFNPY